MIGSCDTHLNISVYPTDLDVLHNPRMNVFDDLLVQRPFLCYAVFHIAERPGVVCNFIYLPEGFAAH